MTRAQFAAVARRSKLWESTAYATTAVAIMLLLSAVWWMAEPQIRMITVGFRDPAKQIQDDGNYGMMIGLLIGVCFCLPSMLLPLLPAVWVNRKLGMVCPACGASLTVWKRHNRVLRSGQCCCCQARLFASEADSQMDEPLDERETSASSALDP